MVQRAQHYLAVLSVVSSIILGLAGLPIWSCAVGGLCLTAIAIREHEKLRPRFMSVGATGMLAMANLASFADGFLVCIAAWCLGAAFRFVLQLV